MRGAFGGLFCGCGGIFAVLLVAAALLRLAVLITNKLLGAGPGRDPDEDDPPVTRGAIPEWDWDDWDDDGGSDERPRPAPAARRRRKPVPDPGTFISFFIALAVAVVGGMGFVILGLAFEEMGMKMRHFETRVAIFVLDLPVGALALVVLLLMSTRTTFWRAAMVAFVYTFLLVGLVFGLVAFVYALDRVF